MNQKRTRVPLPHPPPYRQSRLSYWLTVLAGVLIAIAVCLSIYMLIESWVSGSITTNNRGPRSTYTLALQPRRYWFEFVWQSFWTSFMLAIGVFGLWVYRKGRGREQRPKGKRTSQYCMPPSQSVDVIDGQQDCIHSGIHWQGYNSDDRADDHHVTDDRCRHAIAASSPNTEQV